MNVTVLALTLMLISTFLAGLGSFFLKIGMSKLKLSISINLFLKNYIVFVGLFLYLISSIITIIAYKGGDLSILFPMAALSYIWGTVFAVWLLKEKMNSYKYLAIFFIILGVIVIVR